MLLVEVREARCMSLQRVVWVDAALARPERTDAQRGSMRSWTVAPGEPGKQPIECEREATPIRKVIISEFMTLDGVMEDPGDAEGFKHGGWSFHFGSADQQQFKVEELFKADALLLGRRTYQGFAAAWPISTLGEEVTPARAHQGLAERV
jgi:hypothetical protein